VVLCPASIARLSQIFVAMQRYLTILAAFAVLTIPAACTDPADPALVGTAGKNTLLIVGIDGATWDVIDPMIARGELPNVSRLKTLGAWGPLITVGPQVSPVVWTSFSTGQFARRHGILDFVYPYQPGPRRPVQSTERREPALWNLVSEAGGKVDVVGYFVTYPAEKINGAMVSYSSPQKQAGADYPEDILEPVRKTLDSVFNQEKKNLWSRFLPWDFDPAKPPPEDDPTAEAFRMVSGRVEKRILHAEYNRRASLYLAEYPHDVFITYFGLVDYASHSLWKYYDDTDFETGASPGSKKLLGGVIPEAYRYMDEFIGELLAKSPENANIVIISDHGFGSATGIYSVNENRRDLLTGNHRPNGVFLAAGPDIRAGQIGGLTIIDVFPVLAYLSGLPVADDLPGDLNLQLFTDARLAEHPPEFIRQYDHHSTPAETQAKASLEAQEDNIRSLQGLGYVGDSFELAESATVDFDFWAAEQDLVIQNLVGEVTFHLLKNNEYTASEILAEAAVHDDTLPAKILWRTQQALQGIRDNIGPQAAPENAFDFVRNALSRFDGAEAQASGASP